MELLLPYLYTTGIAKPKHHHAFGRTLVTIRVSRLQFGQTQPNKWVMPWPTI
ncbi:MAG: hypothetical protein AAF709_18460 [Pseudomonadota bacterium]